MTQLDEICEFTKGSDLIQCCHFFHFEPCNRVTRKLFMPSFSANINDESWPSMTVEKGVFPWQPVSKRLSDLSVFPVKGTWFKRVIRIWTIIDEIQKFLIDSKPFWLKQNSLTFLLNCLCLHIFSFWIDLLKYQN